METQKSQRAQLTQATIRKWSHRHSLSITDRLSLLSLERDQLNGAVSAMEGKIKAAKNRIGDIDAVTSGLNQIMNGR